MPKYDAAPLETTIDVAAPPEAVWELVSDLPRMAAWSPQVVRTFLRGGPTVGLGTKAVNINRSGWKVWPTQLKVVTFEPGHKIVFRVPDNWLFWSYELTPEDVDGTPGTHVVHRREAPDGLSPVSAKFQDWFMGGRAAFDAEVLAGMRTTLGRIKTELESRKVA